MDTNTLIIVICAAVVLTALVVTFSIYIFRNREFTKNNNSRTIIILSLSLVILVAVLLTTLLATGAFNVAPPKNYSAIDYVNAFKNAGLPIENVIEYTEDTDVNGLLGRPGQYISKVNFADTRIEQYDINDPVGGTVEVFNTTGDLQNRKKYIEGIRDAAEILASQYIFVSIDELALIRIEFDLTPKQANEYKEILADIDKYLNKTDENAILASTSTPEPTVIPTTTPFDPDKFVILHNGISFQEYAEYSLAKVGYEVQLQAPFQNESGGYTFKIDENKFFAFKLDSDGSILEADYTNFSAYNASNSATIPADELNYMGCLYSYMIDDMEGFEDFFKSVKRAPEGELITDTQAEYGGYKIKFEDASIFISLVITPQTTSNQTQTQSANQDASSAPITTTESKPKPASEPATPSPATPEPAPANTDTGKTAGQKNALKSANQYLRYSAFSYQGLIEQLEYEKYSHEDAVYAADNCGADWNEQALKSANQYLRYSAFSHSGLIGQLEYEKFTSEQAKYGADNCGADWNEQAAKSAKQYLKYSSFSRDSLINQLEYEGFTHDQAVYGVESNGL